LSAFFWKIGGCRLKRAFCRVVKAKNEEDLVKKEKMMGKKRILPRTTQTMQNFEVNVRRKKL
jgi:hypothetical protein